jgi:hypothetical protein
MAPYYVTPTELQDIAMIAVHLTELHERLITRKASVGLGDVIVYDSNGEILGTLSITENMFGFHSA